MKTVMTAGRWVLQSRSYDDSSDDNDDRPPTRCSKKSSRRVKHVPSDSESSDDDAPAPKSTSAVQTKTVTVDDLAATLKKMSLAQTHALQAMLQPFLVVVGIRGVRDSQAIGRLLFSNWRINALSLLPCCFARCT